MTAADMTATAPLTFTDAEKLLAASLPGYTPRVHQQALARQIEIAMAHEEILLAEAGTGTGKSLAALVPAILSGRRTIVATATKALQGQYKDKDLPFLAEHLGVPFSWAVIKGRSNYPCAQKIDDLHRPTSGQAKIISLVRDAEGEPEAVLDRDDLPGVTDTEWMQLSMSSAECPGAGECPFAGQGLCHAQRAKDKALKADVVITNLAYLAIDLRLRSDSGGSVELLGPIEQLVVDEGHNLDSAITSALSDRISLGTFSRLSGDCGGYLNSTSPDGDTAAAALGYAAQELWNELGTEFRLWQEKQRRARADDATMPLTEPRRHLLGDAFQEIGTALQGLWSAIRRSEPGSPKHKKIKMRLDRRVGDLLGRMQSYVTDDDSITIRWAEEEDGKLFLRSIPVSPAPFLNAKLWGTTPTVIMSATLAAGRHGDGRGDFTYTTDILGLRQHSPRTFEAGTSFDYPAQAMLYVPQRDVPAPQGKDMTAWKTFAQVTTDFLVTGSGGGALLLFTSRANLTDAWNRLHGQWEDKGLEVMKQGDAPPAELVRRFREDGNAVLFALRTFFEGIDIPGDALRLVVIDKLPFPVPTDLQFAARCDAVNKAAGRDVSFRKLSMPVMTLPLVQAAGRLLRHADDRGVIAILDPRLMSKGYGAEIIRALPPAKLTTDPREAAAFLKTMRDDS